MMFSRNAIAKIVMTQLPKNAWISLGLSSAGGFRLWGLVLGLGFLSLVGCSDGRPTRIPVSGTITFDGGPPPKDGTIYFNPVEPAEGFPRRGAYAKFDGNGNYSASSFNEGDGLVPGSYKVKIECSQGEFTMEQSNAGQQPASLVPPAYANGTHPDLALEVKPDEGSKTFNVDVKTK